MRIKDGRSIIIVITIHLMSKQLAPTIIADVTRRAVESNLIYNERPHQVFILITMNKVDCL